MTREKGRTKLLLPVTEQDHTQGLANAPVTLVEYGDFECPYCGKAYFIIRDIQEFFGDRLRFVFRNFPLTEAHRNAENAAEAAEAAAEQGKFWEMHDQLFEHQRALTKEYLLKYAQVLNLDIERFKQDLDRRTFARLVHEDFIGGVRSGVEGTPTFFINGVRHDDSFEFATLLAAIEAAMPK
ncbi:MAG: thioredoxin domain-containing protein [Chloroflexi bacterium]|nr:thioredoxin domain-containing protein [Chloroflexota bacterium]OJV95340.1 MAG: disulfide bond formation protein DsbA [Chloroflexi bacterium 54-19]